MLSCIRQTYFILNSNLLPTKNNHIAVGGTDRTDIMRPAIPAEGGININTLVRIPIHAVNLPNRLLLSKTYETVRRAIAPRI